MFPLLFYESVSAYFTGRYHGTMSSISPKSLRLAWGRMSWLESGPEAHPSSAPTLVYLHGLGAGSFCWRVQLEAWAGRARNLALDLPGYGDSDLLPGRRASLSELGEAVAAWLGALRIERFRLIGSSWGGGVGLALAGAHPERIERLLLAAPLHPDFHPHWRQRLLMRPPWTRLAAGILRHGPRRLRYRALAEMWGDPRRMSAAIAREYAQALGRTGFGASAAYTRGWRGDLERVATRLPRLRRPVMLLWGDRDRVIPPASAAALAARLAASGLTPARVLLPGLGHLPFQEDPASFHAAVEPFLFSELQPPD